jgi:eukaryotic-like serine/threonine-protein kinase
MQQEDFGRRGTRAHNEMAPMKLLGSPVNPGDRLDHYRIDRVVADSNTATVFHATDLRDQSEVAIKIPRPEMEGDPTFADRFTREVEIGELLDHPGVIKVIADRDRTGLYMVMEWFAGKTLREILKEEKKLAPERAIRIATAICGALEYIHSRGIVHGDIRPENVLVGDGGRIKLIDFGGAVKAAARRLTLTKLSQVIGASEYVSPEELKGKRGDARSDLYALGVVLYEMLTGKMPFQGSGLYDRILHHPIPPREVDPAISPQLQEVIYRALEREPRNRYANAHDFARDLDHFEQVGIADRPELRDWKKKRGQPSRKYALYALIVLIPLVIFGLLLYMARH